MFVEHRNTDFGADKNRIPGDGVVTGWGTINGRMVYVFAKDFTVFGGSLSETHAQKICKIQDMAMQNGAPVIGLLDAGGARIQEGVAASRAMARCSSATCWHRGVVPQISVIMGPCAGGDVYSPAHDRFHLHGARHLLHVHHRPRCGEDGDAGRCDAGGTGRRQGPHHQIRAWPTAPMRTTSSALEEIRRLYDFLPLNNRDKPPHWPTADDPPTARSCRSTRWCRKIANKPYDMKELILKVADEGDFFEIGEAFAQATSSPASAASKARRWASSPTSRWCWRACSTPTPAARPRASCASAIASTFPIVTFVDVPGFLPGTAQEHGGIIKHGAKLLFAYTEATCPKVTVITRKAYGGAYDVMASKHMRADVNYAWPTAQIAVMGAKGAVEIIFRQDIGDKDAIAARTKEYEDRFLNPFIAAIRGYIDDVIRPHSTRWRIARALRMLQNKQVPQIWKKHDNIPL